MSPEGRKQLVSWNGAQTLGWSFGWLVAFFFLFLLIKANLYRSQPPTKSWSVSPPKVSPARGDSTWSIRVSCTHTRTRYLSSRPSNFTLLSGDKLWPWSASDGRVVLTGASTISEKTSVCNNFFFDSPLALLLQVKGSLYKCFWFNKF